VGDLTLDYEFLTGDSIRSVSSIHGIRPSGSAWTFPSRRGSQAVGAAHSRSSEPRSRARRRATRSRS
jgi:hypothetical protein